MNPRLGKRIHAIVALLAVVIIGWGIARAVDTRSTPADLVAMRQDAAQSAGRQFLDEYVEFDGRVVRRDEGNDVVSEGQAYGMLIAVAIGDEARFRSIWTWTLKHLVRPDGLMSWRWADDHVIDANSAADADLDAARALILAGSRFGAPDLTTAGKRLGAEILQIESVPVGTLMAPSSDIALASTGVAGAGRVLVAGNWTTTTPYTVNPGYFSPRADQQLAEASKDPRWLDLARTQRVVSWQLVGSSALPPDWAGLNASGTVTPAEPPGGGPVHFGLDAARLPIRFAESCNPDDRALAAAMHPILAAPSGDTPALRNLDGSTASDWQHPVSIVAAAATERAAGDADAAAKRLDEASALQQKYPTYYGAAWVALGRIMLSSTLLGDCGDGPDR